MSGSVIHARITGKNNVLDIRSRGSAFNGDGDGSEFHIGAERRRAVFANEVVGSLLHALLVPRNAVRENVLAFRIGAHSKLLRAGKSPLSIAIRRLDIGRETAELRNVLVGRTGTVRGVNHRHRFHDRTDGVSAVQRIGGNKAGIVEVQRAVTARHAIQRIGALDVNRNVNGLARLDLGQARNLVNFGRRRDVIGNRNGGYYRSVRRLRLTVNSKRGGSKFHIHDVRRRDTVFTDEVVRFLLNALAITHHAVREDIVTVSVGAHSELLRAGKSPLSIAIRRLDVGRHTAESRNVLISRTGYPRGIKHRQSIHDRTDGVSAVQRIRSGEAGVVEIERAVTARNTILRIGTLDVNRNIDGILGLRFGEHVDAGADIDRRIVNLGDNRHGIGHHDHRRDGRIIARAPRGGGQKGTLFKTFKLETAIFQAFFRGLAESLLGLAEKTKNRHTQTPSDAGFLRNAKLTNFYKNKIPCYFVKIHHPRLYLNFPVFKHKGGEISNFFQKILTGTNNR